MIKTVIFDIGNVLTEFAWEEYLHSFDLPKEVIKKFADASINHKVWREYDLGNLTDEEIVDNFILNAPELEKEIKMVYKSIHGMIKKVDYAIPWIQELKARGYQVLVLSNFSSKALKDCEEAMDFLPYTDGGILSFRDHLIKPMPEIYELLIERYRLNPQECVFLDDLQRNIDGADKLGIHTILFTNYQDAKEKLEKILQEEN